VFIPKVRDDGAPIPRPHPPSHDGDSLVEESITVEEEHKRNLRCIKERWKNIPDKFKGFEALLESDSEDDETIPSGNDRLVVFFPFTSLTDIARCTRALKHALDHPLLLADSSKMKHRLSGGCQYLRRKVCMFILISSLYFVLTSYLLCSMTTFYSCNMGTSDLPEMYAQSPRVQPED